MPIVNVYLTFKGNCREAFAFYKSVFGGEFSYFSTYAEMPQLEGSPPIPEGDQSKIMHVSLPISKETTLMGSDESEAFGQPSVTGTNFSISVNTESTDEADHIFNALSKNGNITMPMANTFWNSYFGMLTDQFGINWMVDHQLPTP